MRFTGFERAARGLLQHPAGGGLAMGEWIIEPATVEDLPDIVHIEEACFSTPWTRKMFAAELSGNLFVHFLLAKGGAVG